MYPKKRNQPLMWILLRFTFAQRVAKLSTWQAGEPVLTKQKRIRESAGQLIVLTGDCLNWNAGYSAMRNAHPGDKF